MDFLALLEKKNHFHYKLISFLLIGIIGICNFIIGNQINIFLLYIFPISSLAWFVGRKAGIMASFVCVLLLFWVNSTTVQPHSNHLFIIYNSLLTLFFFITSTLLLSKLNSVLVVAKELARIDNLTGAVNSRYFNELLQIEMERLQRYKHPFSLAYFDLDDFKTVNDIYGHLVGNQVLCTVVNYAQNNLRKVDIIARLGGDEFALLLPETGQEYARIVITRFQSAILEEMHQKNWPITLSMGVVTCNTVNCTANELINIADNLMFTIKKNGKNAILFT